MYYQEYLSPMGTLLLSCTDSGLAGLRMNTLPGEGMTAAPDHPILVKTEDWLDAYFRGEKAVPHIPLAPEGTVFQKMVWEILQTIPYGQTRTYGDIAREMAERMGKEKMSAQAVGQAVGANPIAILVPCHRVIGAGGKLTGYAYGLEPKRWLLRHEDIEI